MKLRLIILVTLLQMMPVVCLADVAHPTTAIAEASCVTSECHAKIKQFAVLHGPIAADSCDACHQLADAGKHTFTIRATGAELCTYCHEFSVKGLAVVHKPVQTGECLGCHNPHGGATRAIVREKSMKDLCNRCHESVTAHDKFVHAPVAQGECDSCHPPHASKFPKLLDVVGTDLCLTCHADFERRMTQAAVRHRAMKDGCERCHDVHGSAVAMSLRKPAPELCLECHEKLKAQIEQASVKHSPVTTDVRACLNCHVPHFSAVPKLQPKQTVDVCITCHNKSIKTDHQSIGAVSEVVDTKQFKHGEIKDGQCSGCHDVHGGRYAMLLKNTLSKTYYERFSKDNYALCFGCHDERLVREKTTSTFTAFRNGEINLHVVHANRDDRDKGCNVCHVVHASPNPRLIRASLAYGLWSMPMRFEKTATGGSCFPGCHRKLAYDREHPVPPSTAPTTRESPVLARAGHQEERIVHWSASDRDGQTVAIPDPNRPTVLLIVGSDPDVEKTIQAVTAIQIEDLETCAIVIACGPDASKIADKAARVTPRVPVIVDANLAVADVLDVHGWPTVLVLRSDGTEVARLGGDAQSLSAKLPPYIDLAAGAIDADELRRQLATTPPAEDLTTQTKRTVHVAQALLQQQDFAAALRRAQDALQSDPGSADLQALRVEALLGMDRITDAAAELQKISADRLPLQYAVLQARIAIAQQQWAEARKILDAGLALWPQDPRLNYLMGTICEHDHDWPAAAAHYRAATSQQTVPVK